MQSQTMTSNLITVAPTDAHNDDQIAPISHQTPDGYAPTGVSGYSCGEQGTTVLCPDCTDFGQYDDPYPFMTGESDYPGTVCDGCSRYLNQTLLLYPSGPGGEVYAYHKVRQNRPTLELSDPDGPIGECADYWFEDGKIHFPTHWGFPPMSPENFSDACESGFISEVKK